MFFSEAHVEKYFHNVKIDPAAPDIPAYNQYEIPGQWPLQIFLPKELPEATALNSPQKPEWLPHLLSFWSEDELLFPYLA